MFAVKSIKERNFTDLIEKYNVPVPRYTSYPTVPYWQTDCPTTIDWKSRVVDTFVENQEISLYIHLPFCEALCTYCGCNKRITKNHKVETPYIDTLLKEWKMYVDVLPNKPTIKEIHLGGGTPTFFAPESLERLIKGILSMATLSEDYQFGLEVHPNTTSIAHLQTLYNLGFKRVSIGVQDFAEEVLHIINREQTYEQVFNITNAAKAIGYTSINFDLIFGLPLQTPQHIIQNIEKVKVLSPDRIAFYGYAHVPWVSKSQRAYSEVDLPTSEKKRAMYELGKDLLEKAGYIEIGMDHFALPTDELNVARQEGTLHRNFMGYTPFHTELMIGLGCSAISDSLTGFVQNEKKVEDYQERVEAGEFPFFRGHLLTEEDLVLRKHITNIMCNFKTSWKKEEQQHPSLWAGLERMREMEKDGFVNIGENSLEVTTLGQTFIRNICAALDARLWRNKPATRLFSTSI
jgi:oxygen-independent coproporphyrinogen-3 oxidase